MRKGERTRDEIIRRAAPNFNQRGYEGAAPSDLMEATGLEQGGIYRRTSQSKPARRRSTTPGIALDTRFERTEEVSKVVDRLNVLVQNFQDRRAWLVPGGCPPLNTAIDSADGNPRLRAKAPRALSSWRDRPQSIAEEGR